jgi:DNA-binding transcriptional LysR family regulator
MLPSLASRWLLPGLPRFCDQNPDIAVRVIASRVLDLRAEGTDAAVRFGLGQYTGYPATPLMPDTVLPVCSSSFAKARGHITTIDALLEWPLLHDSSTAGDGSQSDCLSKSFWCLVISNQLARIRKRVVPSLRGVPRLSRRGSRVLAPPASRRTVQCSRALRGRRAGRRANRRDQLAAMHVSV